MKTASFNQTPRLNVAHLEDLIVVDQGRTGLARELLDLCVIQSEQRFKTIARALERFDFDGIERELHAFKTTCHSTGLARAHVMSHDLQMHVASDSVEPEEIKRGLRELRAEVESGLCEVADFLVAKEKTLRQAA